MWEEFAQRFRRCAAPRLQPHSAGEAVLRADQYPGPPPNGEPTCSPFALSHSVSRRCSPFARRTAHIARSRYPSHMPPDLAAAKDLIDREYVRGVSVARLAKLTSQSPFQFIRAFRRVYGVTPGQHLRARRMARAQELLTNTPTPITEIARLVGYQSLGTFSRVFRAVTRESPLAYRRRTRQPVYIPGCFVRMYRADR
jgi:AraC-like DNA-binding protein